MARQRRRRGRPPRRTFRGRNGGLAFGPATYAHWVLDMIVHRADLPILPGNLGHLPKPGFGIWGAVDVRRAGRLAEPLRLMQEPAVTAVAAARSLAGPSAWGIGPASLSLVHHVLVCSLGRRLLEG